MSTHSIPKERCTRPRRFAVRGLPFSWLVLSKAGFLQPSQTITELGGRLPWPCVLGGGRDFVTGTGVYLLPSTELQPRTWHHSRHWVYARKRRQMEVLFLKAKNGEDYVRLQITETGEVAR